MAAKAEKKPRLDSEADGSHHFTQGNSEDEVELKFDDGNSLFVSKSFLAYASPVFKRIFESSFKETNNKTVELKEKNYEAFLEMLLFLHPRKQRKLSDKNAKLVYKMAHKYQITTALKKAQKIMVKEISSLRFEWCNSEPILTKSFEALIFAEAYSDQLLISAATERLSTQPVDDLLHKPQYSQISDTSKIKILMYRLKRCDDNLSFSENLSLQLSQ